MKPPDEFRDIDVAQIYPKASASRQPLERLLVVPRRLRVAAAFLADAERADFGREADARPPSFPPFLDEVFLTALPRPEPLFLPPPVSLFTVAHARRAASPRETPRCS
jgi:hypothetical protein